MKIAVYPGTFDPITNGHTDLIQRACELFDQVIVGVAANASKAPSLSFEQRIKLVSTVLSGMSDKLVVKGFTNLLIEFAQEIGAMCVIRGLRTASDFEYEFQLAGMNRRLAPNVETIFLRPSEDMAYISASLVREVASLGGDVSEFVHPAVVKVLREQYTQ